MAVRQLRWIISRYAPLVVGLPFLLMLLLGWFWLAPQMRQDRDEQQRQFAVAIATQIENYLANARTAVTSLATLLPDPDAADYRRRVQYSLDAAVANLKVLQACYLVGHDGRIEAISVAGGGNREHDLAGVDLSLNKLVRSTLRDHKQRWSDSYLSMVGGGISVALAVPLGRRVLVGELELGNLSRYLGQVSSGSQKIFVLDRRGQVIADRQGSYTAQQMNLGNIPILPHGVPVASLVSGSFELEGERMVGGVFAIPETTWSVLVAQSWEEVNRSLLTSARIVGAGLLSAMLLLSALTLFFTRLLIRRFEMLAGHARLVAESPDCIPWPTCSIAEFNSLADNLSGMARTLRERATLLEEEVHERGIIEHALRGKNQELACVDAQLRRQVDELSRAQETLKQREEAYRTVADWTYDWEYWLSPEGTFLYISPSCERVTGYPVQAFIDDPELMVRITHPDCRQTMREHLEACRTPGGAEDEHLTMLVFRLHARGGGVVWIEHSCRPVFSAEGRYLGRRACNRDITERRALEQQLQQQQKLEGIGLLAGGIAHDFNNMLLPILVGAEMIERTCGGDQALGQRAAMIRQAGNKAKELVKQLLTFSRKQELQPLLYDLNEIVAGFLSMLRRTIREEISLTPSLCPFPCRVQVDRTQIEQVLLNLVVNASDAIAGHGSINLETAHVVFDEEFCRLHPGTAPGKYAMLAFRDTGSGMDDAVVAHVFEPFFTTKPVGKGTGLGLSTSYGIIRKHGGSIDVQSTVGRGSTFRIYLPLAEAGDLVQEAAEPVAQSQGEGGATILVVEDNPMVLEMVREILQVRGFTVLAAALPGEAIELVRRHGAAIDLLLSDVVMPEMSGPELYERLAELRPGLRALFMSGYASSAVVHRGQLQEGVNLVAKPFTSEELLKKVDQFLGRGEPVRAGELG